MTKRDKDKLIKQLKKALQNEPISLAYLYGSYARGQENVKSDIDIAIVLNPKAQTADYEIGGRIQSKLGKGFPEIDVREITTKSEPVFLRSILKDRITLVSKNEKERVGFETRAMRRFFDTEHLRNLNYYYLKNSLKEGTYGRPGNFKKLA